ncbi:hypothetical protein KGF54_000860 [Candida jiufengensis]|uniref:uncharacterized protein n=1 Tax=Candida jiufengensis TaxID=497108 RepID=UPI0022244EFD|nr:uncharacterized protein KGF54_000860 [Candida jiufengensis]KAI5956385.1 hypothetical protein KGF54_000860 [Candida jiufengensis]
MDAFWTNLPPITKGWCISTLTISTLITLKKLKFINLLFIPEKIFNQQQTWRIITTFITFNELSFDLIIVLWEISHVCSQLENSYSLTKSLLPYTIVSSFDQRQWDLLNSFIDRNKSIDFLYFLIQICISIIALATYLYFKFEITIINLGSILLQSLTYYDSKITPNRQINFFGVLIINNLYYPYFIAFLNLLTQEISKFEEITNNNNQQNQGIISKVKSFFNKPSFWMYLISFGLGHFWWCSKELILKDLHYDNNFNLQSLKIRSNTLKQYRVWKFDFVRELLVMILLPPWYWIIISKIKNNQQRNQIQHPL